MLIVVTGPIIVIIEFILLTIVSLVKLQAIKYTNEFVLHVREGEPAAQALANKYQLKFERQVGRAACRFDRPTESFLQALPNENYFVFRQLTVRRRRKRSPDGSDPHLLEELQHDPSIDWVEQQQVKKRVKRSVMSYHPAKSTSPSTFNDPEWDKQWYMVRIEWQPRFFHLLLLSLSFSMMKMNTDER